MTAFVLHTRMGGTRSRREGEYGGRVYMHHRVRVAKSLDGIVYYGILCNPEIENTAFHYGSSGEYPYSRSIVPIRYIRVGWHEALITLTGI